MYEQQQKRIAALALAILVFGGVIAGLVLLFRVYSAEAQREPEKKPQVDERTDEEREDDNFAHSVGLSALAEDDE